MPQSDLVQVASFLIGNIHKMPLGLMFSTDEYGDTNISTAGDVNAYDTCFELLYMKFTLWCVYNGKIHLMQRLKSVYEIPAF